MMTMAGHAWRMSHTDQVFHQFAEPFPTEDVPVLAACGVAVRAHSVDPVASTGDAPPLCPLCLVRAGTVEADQLEARWAARRGELAPPTPTPAEALMGDSKPTPEEDQQMRALALGRLVDGDPAGAVNLHALRELVSEDPPDNEPAS
ncbi:hypothetical protein [Saccharothrix lopnurensis]|uniref:Uncharacterized protein n=1 Tax=Saccharothrix lopnurensis TaxID=1670621 RepID=A0ABW1P6H2_9PSEU